MQLQLVDVRHRYGEREVLRGVSLALQPGEIGCLLGPSGCGKTTALRCVAGFETVDGGEIVVDAHTLSRPGHTVAPERRRIGMVFQDPTLLPHLDALGNVAFGLHALPSREREGRAREVLATVGLADAATQYPHEMSGGQQQRVALARALAPRPRLLLLDEPFSNLDATLRDRLGREVRDILKREGVTALLVTHDQYEAFALADEIGVMRDGVVAQWGTAHEIYHQPVDRHVADFVGRGVVLPARVTGPDRIEVAGMAAGGAVPQSFAPGAEADLLLRPDDIVESPNGVVARVVDRSFLGPTIVYGLELAGGERVLASLPAHREHGLGATLRIAIRPAHLVLFPPAQDPVSRRDDASGR